MLVLMVLLLSWFGFRKGSYRAMTFSHAGVMETDKRA